MNRDPEVCPSCGSEAGTFFTPDPEYPGSVYGAPDVEAICHHLVAQEPCPGSWVIVWPEERAGGKIT